MFVLSLLLACAPKQEPVIVWTSAAEVAAWLQKFGWEVPPDTLPAEGQISLESEVAAFAMFPVTEAEVTMEAGAIQFVALRITSGGSMAIEQLEANASEMCLTLEPKVVAPCRGYTASGVNIDVRTWREGAGDDEVGHLSVLVGRGAPGLEWR